MNNEVMPGPGVRFSEPTTPRRKMNAPLTHDREL